MALVVTDRSTNYNFRTRSADPGAGKYPKASLPCKENFDEAYGSLRGSILQNFGNDATRDDLGATVRPPWILDQLQRVSLARRSSSPSTPPKLVLARHEGISGEDSDA